MKTIVVSAVNLRKGGTLTILRDCLYALSCLSLSGEYRIVALVHDKSLASFPGIEYIELPWSLKNWVLRLWCEYVTMYRISKSLSPVYLWLSLHDTTPNVKAERRVVYCHNSYPFLKWKWRDLFFNYRIVCFACFSKFIYQTNIGKNYRIIVQQQWLRDAFMRIFSLKQDHIIVALPSSSRTNLKLKKVEDGESVYSFLFASFCDIHKNFEILCDATLRLEREIGRGKFKVYLTVNGNENKYTRWLYKKWGKVDSLSFIGFLDKMRLNEYYKMTDCLVFPSKVETWGLPISEFAVYDKPMLLADLPYAYETAAGSHQTAFFDPYNAEDLKEKMKCLINGDSSFLSHINITKIERPSTRTWNELINLLLQ